VTDVERDYRHHASIGKELHCEYLAETGDDDGDSLEKRPPGHLTSEVLGVLAVDGLVLTKR